MRSASGEPMIKGMTMFRVLAASAATAAGVFMEFFLLPLYLFAMVAFVLVWPALILAGAGVFFVVAWWPASLFDLVRRRGRKDHPVSTKQAG